MPRNSQPTKDRILASAERLFAENGFDGTSMREIASHASSQLALIHYHFGSKLDLYRAIWAARYTTEVAERREASFSAVNYKDPQPDVIRTLVEIFLLPLMKIAQDKRLRDFVAIGARETTDPKEAEHGMLQEFLDPSGKRFIECFKRALPDVSPTDVAWGYQAMVGVSVLYIADRNRITRISNGTAKAGDGHSATQPMVEFCVGGWLALAEKRKGQSPRTEKGATSTSVPSANAKGTRVRPQAREKSKRSST